MQLMGWIQKSGGNFANSFQKLRWNTLSPQTEVPPDNAIQLPMQPGLENRPFQDLYHTEEQNRSMDLNWEIESKLHTQNFKMEFQL